MGRPAKVATPGKPGPKGGKARGVVPAPKRVPTRLKTAVPKASKAKAVAALRQAVSRPAPISKDELRAQLEKLAQENGVLRTKARDARRGEKLAAGRIAELEVQVARLEKKASSAPEHTPKPKPPKPARKARSQDRAPTQGTSDVPGEEATTPDDVAAE